MFLSNLKRIVLVIFCSILLEKCCGIAVMSVDIGTEWMKVAIVSPGVPMEIALNKESQRKTPVSIAFRDGERMFGDPALTIGVRFPDKAYGYLLDVLGKEIDNPVVQLYQKRFPYYSIVPDAQRNTVIFKHPEGLAFTPEELISMLLKQAQGIAERAAGQPIKDAVITVPPFFNQAERQALLVAARLSGINVLQLINSNTAAALNYGVFRRKDFNETPVNIMFFDMGAGSTVATIVSYQLVKSKETGEVSPQLTVKGVGFDRSLGGLEMQLRLRDHFAKAFDKEGKTKLKVFENNRAMAKLLKEAGRVKKVLSANTDHMAQVESLLDDKDFRCPVSRAEFEALCADLFERVVHPVEVALKSANMDMAMIDQVILAGSGARVPKVQQILLDFVKKPELGKSINTDESAALGAAYQAAYLSKGFKVKSFLIRDINVYPIQVEFQRDYQLDDGSPAVKTVRRLLFARNNLIPQKKVMTFNRLDKDFDFFINYAELNFLSDFQLKALGSLNLSKVHLTLVGDAIKKHSGENVEYKGVKAYFKMDESGVFQFDAADSVFDKLVEDEEEDSVSNLKSTLTKLGQSIGNLFSSSDPEPTSEPVGSEDAKKETPVQQEETNSSDAKPANTSEKEKPAADIKQTESTQNATKKESKIVTVKEPLTADTVFLGIKSLSQAEAEASIKKLRDLDEHDKAKLAKEKMKNSLESFIIDTKDKLSSSEYEEASQEKELNELKKALDEARDWLDYETSDATAADEFKNRLHELKKSTRDLFERVKEHHDRPEAIKALTDMLNLSNVFLSGAKNMSEEDQIFTEVELKTLEKLIVETEAWVKENEAIQAAQPRHLPPKLTTKLIAEKIAGLDREVKYLLNKARFAPPLKKKKTTEKEEKTDQNTSASEKQPEVNETETIAPVNIPEADIQQTKETIVETKKQPEVNETETIAPIEIPEADIQQTKETTVETSSTPGPETPSPDTVQDESHSEL